MLKRTSAVYLATMIAASLTNTASAAQDGFATDDLTTLDYDLADYEGGAFQAKKEAGRTSLICLECTSLTAVDIALGETTDGTEERYRSGETTLEHMEGLCQQRDESCTMAHLEIGDAVGWRSSYTAGAMAGATAVLFENGDMLTIRSIGENHEIADANLDRALDEIAPAIIGE